MKRLFLISLCILAFSGCSGKDKPQVINFDTPGSEEEDMGGNEEKSAFNEGIDPEEESASEEDAGAAEETEQPEEEDIPVIIMEDEPEDGNKYRVDTPERSEEPAAEEMAEEDEGFHGYVLSEEEAADPRVQCMETAREGHVIMDFAGDISFDEHYSVMASYRSHGSTMSGVMSDNLIQELRSADIFVINNEFPYSDRGTPTPDKKYTFRARPSMVNNLLELGADLAGLANNHAYDHGPDALLDTFDTLEGAGIGYVGAGRDLEEAMKPYYFIAGGMKIGVVAATQIERTSPPDTKEATENSPGVLRTLDPARFLTVIEESENNADATVVFVHWGSENKYEAEDSQRQLAKSYAGAGADLIVGAHSHCLQGFEYVEGVPVLYSLGNFWFSSKDRDSGVLQAEFAEGSLQSVRFLPCIQHNCRTDMYEKGEGEYDRILGVMAGLSYDVSIDGDGYISPGAGTGISPLPPKPL